MPTLEIFLALFIFILIVLISIEDISTGFLFLLILMTLQHKELFSLVAWDILPIRIAFFGILLTTFYRFYLWYRRHKKTEDVLRFLKDPFLILLILLYIVRFLSILLFAENKVSGIKLLAFYTTIVYFYILVKYLYMHYGYAFIKKSLVLYGVLGLLTSIVGLIQYVVFKINGFKFGAIWEIPGHDPRIGSTFWDVNHFGAFLISVLPISIAFIFTSKKYMRIFWVVSTFITLGVLYLTESRSAWLGFAVSSFLMVILLFIKGFKNFARVISVVGVSIFVITFVYFEIYGNGLVEQYKKFMHTRLDSFTTHFLLLRGAYEAYATNPIIGSGYGNFNEVFRETKYADRYFFHEKYIVDQRVPSHSIWGEVISETGFLGFLFYSLFFIGLILLLYRGYIKTKSTESIILLGSAGSIVALLTAGLFYTYNLEFFWFVTFLSVMLAYEYNKSIDLNKFYSFISSQKYLVPLVLFVYTSVLYFWDLGRTSLIDWDEAIYAKVSRNIIERGEFLTLYWLGDSPWFEKPPFYMWVSSKLMYLFGPSEITARLPSAFFGVLAVIFIYYFAKYLFKSRFVAFISALMLATTADFWYYSRLGMLDVTVTFFIISSLYFGYLYLDKRNYKYAILSGLLCGFGVMTKAVVGLLPIPILTIFIIYLLISRKVNLITSLQGVLLFILSFFIIALPWHLAMYLKHGDNFVNTYLNEHILNRGLTDSQGKTQPFFWYIERIKVSFRGWFIILIPSLIYLVYKIKKNSVPHIFIFIYAIFIFIFFSVSTSKLIWYIIPIYPALALINASFVREALLYVYTKFSIYSRLISKVNIMAYLGVSALLFILSLFVYNLNSHHLVYVPDFNKDLVAVIDDYNEKYAELLEDPENQVDTLHYLRIPTPVVAFYTDGKIQPTDVEPFEEMISSAAFYKPFAYISRQGEVASLKEIYGDDIIRVANQRGAYFLTYVRSQEEYYNAKIEEAKAKIDALELTYISSENKKQVEEEINNLFIEIYEDEVILHTNMPEKYATPILKKFDPALLPVF